MTLTIIAGALAAIWFIGLVAIVPVAIREIRSASDVLNKREGAGL